MIDLHAHILPSFDDGPSSWEEARDMLRQAEEDGIVELVATPHILGPSDFARQDEIKALFAELCRVRDQGGLKLRLHLGAEIYAHHELRLDGPFFTLGGNGRYFMVEFPMENVPPFVGEQFFNLIMDGYTPLVAHPERNLAIMRDPGVAETLVERGALLQINSGSLRGVFGPEVRRLAEQLLNAQLVHVVASDAHGASARRPRLQEAFGLVAERWGEETATRLFIDNPRRILAGQKVEAPEPLPLRAGESSGPFQRLRRLLRGKQR
ncbi:MAG: phosphotransferase [candidate division KSB1 bacterium]|nr:phosphotransferase [candidate division KSB1 bacterium]